MLTAAGLTIMPIDLGRLSTVQRGVLGDWASYWAERVKDAREAAASKE